MIDGSSQLFCLAVSYKVTHSRTLILLFLVMTVPVKHVFLYQSAFSKHQRVSHIWPHNQFDDSVTPRYLYCTKTSVHFFVFSKKAIFQEERRGVYCCNVLRMSKQKTPKDVNDGLIWSETRKQSHCCEQQLHLLNIDLRQGPRAQRDPLERILSTLTIVFLSNKLTISSWGPCFLCQRHRGSAFVLNWFLFVIFPEMENHYRSESQWTGQCL